MQKLVRRSLFCLFSFFLAFAAMASAQVTVTVLINFDQSNGYYPMTPLMQGYDGQIYGTTYNGGPNNLCEQEYDCGTFFSLASTNLYNFCSLIYCDDGSQPYGVLVQAPNGLLYGTTQGGGVFPNNECRMQWGCGTVFSITAYGLLTTLHSFTRTDGEAPEGGLLLGSSVHSTAPPTAITTT